MSEIRLLLANMLTTEAMAVNTVTWSYQGFADPLATTLIKKRRRFRTKLIVLCDKSPQD